MKIFFVLTLLIINMSTNAYAKDFMLVSNNNEDCYIEGTIQDNLITGFGVCIDNYEVGDVGITEHSYMYGNYESGKKTGLFLEMKASTSLDVSFSEYKNDMIDGYHINLFGEDRYWIYQFENGIEQGLTLINYDILEAVNEYSFMVDGGADFEYEISPDEIKDFELGFIVFRNLIAKTFGISDIKKYAASEESFKDLGTQAMNIIKNFLDTMCDKYDKEFCYQ